jgi:membrane protein implicated in regulation of membrane protease activity
MLALLAALVLPGAGWLLFAVLKVVLVTWLVVGLAGVIVMGRFRSRMRRAARDGHGYHRRQDWPAGYARQWCGHWR